MSNEKQKKLFMIGAFPPPVHGMAAVNAAVRELFKRAGVEPVVLDVAAESLNRSFAVRLGRLPKVTRGLMRLLFQHKIRDGSLYMSISGGFGQIYEILFLIVARFYRMRTYLHHHNFVYLDRPSFITRVLTTVAGSRSVHITQSHGMKARLMKNYTSVRRTVPVSNVVFLTDSETRMHLPHTRLKTIGFISNITEQKGIFEFLQLAAFCEAQGLGLEAKVAGPFQDVYTERRVRQRFGELSAVEYIGPVYGTDKACFFGTIDTLIFPSRSEADPVTIYEAMQAAVPVIAYGRGCIPEVVSPACGLVIDPAESFLPASLNQLKRWMDNSRSYNEASRSAVERFTCVLKENLGRGQDLLREITNGNSKIC
ncbi:MAG: glycosyltransferase family 4 protein [Syntrophorhabdus sp.]